MAKSKIYALLIGINEYDYFEEEEGEFNLDGCVRDSQAIGNYLKETVVEGHKRLFIRNLNSPKAKPQNLEGGTNNCASEKFFKATRKTFIKGFQKFLSKAKSKDTVLIYFSGHGLRQEIPEEMRHLDSRQDPDHKGEAFMCSDTYTEKRGKWIPAIKDWEIRWLISKIGKKKKKKPHIVFLSDCCYSSGNTKDIDIKTKVKVRGLEDLLVKNAPSTRSLDELIFYQESKKIRKLLKNNPEDFALPEGRHVTLAAAHHYELAKETDFQEGRFGIFTYFLLKVLRATKGNISYRDLTKLIRSKTVHEIDFQTPQYYATVTEDAELFFLGGKTAQNQQYYSARAMLPNEEEEIRDKAILDAGSLHGIPLTEIGKTEMVLFPNHADPDLLNANDLMKGELITVNPHESIIQLLDGALFPKDAFLLKAKLTALPLPKTRVFLESEIDEHEVVAQSEKQKAVAKGIKLFSKALADNLFLERIHQPEFAQYRLWAYHFEGKEKYRITKKDRIEALVAPKIGFSPISAEIFVQEMEHIARWERTLRLENNQPELLKAGDIELLVLNPNDEIIPNPNGLIELSYKRTDNAKEIPQIKLKVQLKKEIETTVYCAIIHLGADYSIDTDYLAPETKLGKASFIDDEKEINFEQWEIYALHAALKDKKLAKDWSFGLKVSDELLKRGINVTEDHFKLIVSTEQFDARHLYQKNLDNPDGDRDFAMPKVNGPLDFLLQTTHSRETTTTPTISDWYSTLITVRTTCEEE